MTNVAFIKKFLLPLSAVGTGVGFLVIWRDRLGGKFEGTENAFGRTVIVTGASSGIGKATSQELAARGARIIMACRDLDKCEKMREVIEKETLNQNVECKKLDLNSFKSIRQFADDINKNEVRLDVLVNNAGVMGLTEHTITEDGIETHFATNYLGHFLLTQLLLDKLKKSAPSRIILNTSAEYRKAKINFEDLNSTKDYSFKKAYGQSKLANMYFTEELDRRLQGTDVQPFCTFTGLSFTKIHRHMKWYKSMFSGYILTPFFWLAMNNVTFGAQNTIHCVLNSEICDRESEDFSLFQKSCKPVTKLDNFEFDEDISKRLWITSEVWTGLREFPKQSSPQETKNL